MTDDRVTAMSDTRRTTRVVRRVLFVPGPLPGLNQLVAAAKRRSPNGWTGYAGLKRLWEQRVGQIVRAMRLPRFERIWLAFRWIEPSRRRDPDNVAAGGRKIILDALVSAGVVSSDGWRTVVGWSDRFEISRRSPGVELTVIGSCCRPLAVLVTVGLILALACPPSWAGSPLNLHPEWPLRLDDAYPVRSGEWQWQTAVRHAFIGSATRFTVRTDVRIGLSPDWELDLGATPVEAGRLDGDLIDQREVRVGLLARVLKQDGWVPHQAVRITLAPPIDGSTHIPSLRADLLESWKLDQRTWIHLNASYLVAPDARALSNRWWQARLGVVRALTSSGVALAASAAVVSSPFETASRLTPDIEAAVIVPVAERLMVHFSGGSMIEAYRTDSAIRVQVGVSWTF